MFRENKIHFCLTYNTREKRGTVDACSELVGFVVAVPPICFRYLLLFVVIHFVWREEDHMNMTLFMTLFSPEEM